MLFSLLDCLSDAIFAGYKLLYDTILYMPLVRTRIFESVGARIFVSPFFTPWLWMTYTFHLRRVDETFFRLRPPRILALAGPLVRKRVWQLGHEYVSYRDRAEASASE